MFAVSISPAMGIKIPCTLKFLMASILILEVLHYSLKFNAFSIFYEINKLKQLERPVIRVFMYVVASIQPLHKSLFFEKYSILPTLF